MSTKPLLVSRHPPAQNEPTTPARALFALQNEPTSVASTTRNIACPTPAPDYTSTMFFTRCTVALGLVVAAGVHANPPQDDPAASLKLAWTAQVRWGQIIDITAVAGKDPAEKLAAAQAQLAPKGGGVVYFPPGVYRFEDSIRLHSGIILRGAAPVGKATDEGYSLGTRFEFPRYNFSTEGNGTPIDSAFKGIYLEDPATASNCGLVHIDIECGHVRFAEAEDHTCGSNRIVLGCIFRNAATADAKIPDIQSGQKPWQRFTNRFGAAIDVKTRENALIAGNRLPASGQANFTMNGYVLKPGGKKPNLEADGVVFDYDNRPGIYVNHYNIGGPGGQGPDGTPETHPYGFRKGIVIRDNFIYATGRCAIGFCGDGVECRNNVIRFAKGVWRPTTTGTNLTAGSATNDNRAVEMRGWRWILDSNDYEVYRNLAYDKKYEINDGEGLMHEDHANSTVKDSILRNNKGNTYLSIYKTAGIDGLVVEGNDVPSIMVVADRNSGRFPIRNVRIVNNTTRGPRNAIHVGGDPAQNVVVQGNKHEGSGGKILNQAAAKLESNQGYEVDTTPWKGKK